MRELQRYPRRVQETKTPYLEKNKKNKTGSANGKACQKKHPSELLRAESGLNDLSILRATRRMRTSTCKLNYILAFGALIAIFFMVRHMLQRST